MSKKKGYLSVLIGLFTLIGVAGVTSCATEEATNTRGYGYMPYGTVAYEGFTIGQRITMDQAEELVKDYLRDNTNLRAEEIIEFTNDFYVRFSEKDTGINAFAALIHPYNGRLYPGHHPDKYWNTKYQGGFKDLPSGPMTVTEEQAWNAAQRFIVDQLYDATAGTIERFYGYYTVPVLLLGEVIGLLDINGYTGDLCYEACHGSLVERRELR